MYIEILFFLNIVMDFFTLYGVNCILNNHATLNKLILGSLFGSLLTLIVFINISSYLLIIIKLIWGILIAYITFGNHLLINTIYLYMISTIMAGIIYYLSLEIPSNILVILLFPILFYLFLRQYRKDKRISNLIYQLDIYINDVKYSCNAYLDTGNNIKDYICHKKIIVVDKSFIKDINKYHPYYIPINSINNHSLMALYRVQKIVVNNQLLNNYVIGISSNKLNFSNARALLPNYIEEDINV